MKQLATFLERDYITNSISLGHIEEITTTAITIDVISDETFKFNLSGVYKPNKSDLVMIKNISKNYKENFFEICFIEKVFNNEIHCKSLYSLFNQVDKMNTYSTSLELLMEKFFNNNTIDPLQNLNFINFNTLQDDLIPDFSSDKQEISNNDIRNYREVFLKSIPKNRRTLSYDFNNTQNITINIKTENQTPKQININPTTISFFAKPVEIPQIETSTNVVSYYVRITRIDKITNDLGEEVEVETIEQEKNLNYYLLKNNTITTNAYNTNRVVPPKKLHKEIFLSYKQGETLEEPDYLQLAEEVLLDTSKYDLTIEVFNNSNSINVERKNLKLFQLYDIVKDGVTFRTLLTGYKIMVNTTELRFGNVRNDLIYFLNQERSK